MKLNRPCLRLLTTLLGLTLGFLTVSHANAANLLLNGGFEFGQAPGTFRQAATYGAWTAVGANGPALIGLPYPQIPGLEGANAMHIGNARLAGIVRQSFATTIGQQYVVRLWAVGYAGETGSGTIRVYNSGQTDLTSLFSSPGGYRWRQNEFKFTASGTVTTLEMQNVPPAATTIDHVSVTAVPAPGVPVVPEIETFYTDRFTFLWNDVGSGASSDGSFWAPSIPAGQSIYALGHVAQQGMPNHPASWLERRSPPRRLLSLWVSVSFGTTAAAALTGMVQLGNQSPRRAMSALERLSRIIPLAPRHLSTVWSVCGTI